MKWISVKDKLPRHGGGCFLGCWENQGNLMFVCFVNIHGVYIIAGSSGDSCGHGEFPNFSHWMPMPEPPSYQVDIQLAGVSMGLSKDEKEILSQIVYMEDE